MYFWFKIPTWNSNLTASFWKGRDSEENRRSFKKSITMYRVKIIFKFNRHMAQKLSINKRDYEQPPPHGKASSLCHQIFQPPCQKIVFTHLRRFTPSHIQQHSYLPSSKNVKITTFSYDISWKFHKDIIIRFFLEKFRGNR